ncbi:hypothetical protein [Lapillicoccus jejuensis]|uniref:Uncharacterized protein n=1 Tax=Lapillicoccus jejuensis TaxID=402171 RepID=A0A542DYP2_9MICO|nr:hypothetical protein [Lapillicoccus jejuensis]TQJ08221.1 hypothetical protein FB458_1305 [Lapillicoccus jejuensis]
MSLVVVPAVDLTTAQASVPSNYCSGKSYTYLVKTYAYGVEKLALRCGTASWGFVHIANYGRWNSTFDSMIALTISQGEKVTDLQQDGGNRIFALFDGNCHELFRVIYNGNAYNGSGVSPQGIITAYYSTSGTAKTPGTIATYPQMKAGVTNPAYRTDCPVIQNI